MASLRAMRIGLLVLVIVAGTGIVVSLYRSRHNGGTAPSGQWVVTASPSATPTAAASPTPGASAPSSPIPVGTVLRAGPVSIDSPGFWSWALLDTRTGRIDGARNMTATSTTASMIKAWIAADYLRLNPNPGQARLDQLRIMIRDSNNAAAHEIFGLIGENESIERLISICKLTDSSPYRTYWSNTMVSARDTARMAACIGNGRAAGPKWTSWVLNEMRNVRGFGNFGIREVLRPDVAAQTAIKNGWVLRESDGNWHVACLAIGNGWTLGVLARYPGRLGVTHGADICTSVAAQLMH